MARVEHYSFGRIVVDGREEQTDVILLPDRTVSHWWRRQGHELVIGDLAEVLPELPERLLIGTGMDGRMHPAGARQACSRSSPRTASRSRCSGPRRLFTATANSIPNGPPPRCTSPAE